MGLVQKMIDGVNKLWEEDKKYQKQYFGDFPFIASQHSLVAKHVTKDKWDALKNIKTKTSGFTLTKAIACAVTFNNQHCGIYAGDWDSYKDFAPVLTPSSRNTTESAPLPDIHLTWILPRSKEMLCLMPQFTLPEFVLVVPLMDLDFL